jgi:HAE1 family hydrophobic/amphiphilic exporter-1
MTSIAALFGALPIALGIGGASAKTRVSLGLVVVGGLIISQIITLFLTPVIYYYLETLQEKINTIFTSKKNINSSDENH